MSSPLLTVLSYSGGRQSAALLWMVLRGHKPRPKDFVVLNADPGMENAETYAYNDMMFAECRKAGIEGLTVSGPNLRDDLLSLRSRGATRLDHPPYWTKDPDTGKEGKLRQSCTAHYKIAPMDRVIRRILEERHGISRRSKRLPPGCVVKWIGFGYDEVFRLKDPAQKYVQFQYPLIDMRMTREDVDAYFHRNGLPIPPRSVCNACFANGLATLKEMHDNRPKDWEDAVAIDESVRDLSQLGIEREVFVSKTLIPLRTLAVCDFFAHEGQKDNDGHSCDSGYCFT